ncbi:MAG: iron donor protein CyaY [Proteobacteria bacterium]|nr:iron donor protein CyaY [Pseudomonadota bacterium]
MTDSEFERLATETLAGIEAAVEACADSAGVDVDLQMKPGGILELGFEDGSKMIINRQSATRELWVAARSGGFHFRHEAGRWVDTRDGGELFAALSRMVGAQSGCDMILAPR